MAQTQAQMDAFLTQFLESGDYSGDEEDSVSSPVAEEGDDPAPVGVASAPEEVSDEEVDGGEVDDTIDPGYDPLQAYLSGTGSVLDILTGDSPVDSHEEGSEEAYSEEEEEEGEEVSESEEEVEYEEEEEEGEFDSEDESVSSPPADPDPDPIPVPVPVLDPDSDSEADAEVDPEAEAKADTKAEDPTSTSTSTPTSTTEVEEVDPLQAFLDSTAMFANDYGLDVSDGEDEPDDSEKDEKDEKDGENVGVREDPEEEGDSTGLELAEDTATADADADADSYLEDFLNRTDDDPAAGVGVDETETETDGHVGEVGGEGEGEVESSVGGAGFGIDVSEMSVDELLASITTEGPVDVGTSEIDKGEEGEEEADPLSLSQEAAAILKGFAELEASGELLDEIDEEPLQPLRLLPQEESDDSDDGEKSQVLMSSDYPSEIHSSASEDDLIKLSLDQLESGEGDMLTIMMKKFGTDQEATKKESRSQRMRRRRSPTRGGRNRGGRRQRQRGGRRYRIRRAPKSGPANDRIDDDPTLDIFALAAANVDSNEKARRQEARRKRARRRRRPFTHAKATAARIRGPRMHAKQPDEVSEEAPKWQQMATKGRQEFLSRVHDLREEDLMTDRARVKLARDLHERKRPSTRTPMLQKPNYNFQFVPRNYLKIPDRILDMPNPREAVQRKKDAEVARRTRVLVQAPKRDGAVLAEKYSHVNSVLKNTLADPETFKPDPENKRFTLVAKKRADQTRLLENDAAIQEGKKRFEAFSERLRAHNEQVKAQLEPRYATPEVFARKQPLPPRYEHVLKKRVDGLQRIARTARKLNTPHRRRFRKVASRVLDYELHHRVLANSPSSPRNVMLRKERDRLQKDMRTRSSELDFLDKLTPRRFRGGGATPRAPLVKRKILPEVEDSYSHVQSKLNSLTKVREISVQHHEHLKKVDQWVEEALSLDPQPSIKRRRLPNIEPKFLEYRQTEAHSGGFKTPRMEVERKALERRHKDMRYRDRNID